MTVIDGRLAAALAGGQTVMGAFVNVASPALVEMAGHAGFDFVVIDNEHGPAGVETTEHLVRAAACAGTAPIVRVSANERQEILRALDTGASGIHVPQVSTPEQAALMAAAASYPPEGIRGVAYSTRAAGYGFFGGVEHLRRSNERRVVVLHVETAESVERLDEILAVPGIDVAFIGPTDLSVSLGYPGEPGHPDVQAVIADCLSRIAASGVVPGTMAAGAEDAIRLAERGFRYLAVNAPGLLADSMRTFLAAARIA